MNVNGFFFGHCALLYVLETAASFFGVTRAAGYFRKGWRAPATVDNTKPIQSNIKSATCRTNASIIKAFPQTSLSAFVGSSRHCYRKDSFASHVYQNTHNKNNNTKVISDVFDSCSLRLNKQQRVWEWCLGTNLGFGFLGDWVRASTNFESVPKATKYVDGFMMIIVSEKWLMPVCTLLSSSWLEITL